MSHHPASRHEESGAPVGLRRSTWVQNILPWATSIVIHAAIILIGVGFFLGARYVVRTAVRQVQVVIPDNSIINDRPPGVAAGLNSPLPNPHPRPEETTDSPSFPRGPKSTIQIAGNTVDEGNNPDPLIGVSLPGGGFTSGGGGGDMIRPFGAPGGGAAGGAGSPVFLPSGNAHKLAFVCDASGSMLVKFPALRHELIHTIEGLSPNQAFNVIFFQDQNALALNPSSLVMATPQNKVKAADFLEDKVTPRGTTDPIPGLVLAFKQQPQLIYLLTDGDFPDNRVVLQKIRNLNKDHNVKINTIAFVGANDTDTDFIKLLKLIAQENGGVYKYVKEGDL